VSKRIPTGMVVILFTLLSILLLFRVFGFFVANSIPTLLLCGYTDNNIQNDTEDDNMDDNINDETNGNTGDNTDEDLNDNIEDSIVDAIEDEIEVKYDVENDVEDQIDNEIVWMAWSFQASFMYNSVL
jgi:hypothetical protein